MSTPPGRCGKFHRGATTRRGARTRRGFVIASIVAVLPVAVAAVRNGIQGWEPMWDAGTVAVRVRDVFSTHPPLYGLAAAPSQGGDPYSYLGAPEFYLLAVPVKVLGTTWGMLLGMAVINIAALLGALWLVRRRVGERAGIIAAIFVASLTWALGSEFLIAAPPVQAVIIPFLTFLVAAWSVADGDDAALFVTALLGNYLILGHPAMVAVVPVTGLFALGFRFVVARASLPARRGFGLVAVVRAITRRTRRWTVAALAVTVVLWLPPLYEQLTSPTGNLRLLVEASSGSRGTGSATWASAVSAVTTMVAVPPLWLTGGLFDPPFDSAGSRHSAAVVVACGVALLGLVGVLVSLTRKPEDATLRRGLAIGGVAAAGWVVTWRLNPSDVLSTGYFWGLWPLSMFIWLLLTVTVLRLVVAHRPVTSEKLARGLLLAGVVGVVMVALPAFARQEYCTGRCASHPDPRIEAATGIRSTTARAMNGHAPVILPSSLGEFGRIQPAIVLGLQDAGTQGIASTAFDARQFDIPLATKEDARTATRLVLTSRDAAPRGGTLLGTFPVARQIAPTDYARLNERVTRWLDTPTSLVPLAEEQLERSAGNPVYHLIAMVFLHDARQGPADLALARFVDTLEIAGIEPRGSILDIPGMTKSEVHDWATERARRAWGPYRLYAVEPPGASSSNR